MRLRIWKVSIISIDLSLLMDVAYPAGSVYLTPRLPVRCSPELHYGFDEHKNVCFGGPVLSKKIK